jgi:hypothetical protein
MASPAAVNYGAQYGVETVPGVEATASTDFRALTVTISPVVETGKHRSSGSRFVNTVYTMKEHSEGNAEGIPCWNDMAPLMTWVAGQPTVVSLDDETVKREWILGNGLTRTIEYGDRSTGYGARISGAFVQSLNLEFGRVSGDSTISAELMGGVFQDDIALTTITSTPEVSPITANDVSVYVDSTLASIGTSKLVDTLSVSFETGDIRTASWTLDSAKDSFSDVVESPMEDAKVSLKVKATAAGRGFLEDLRSGTKKYLRIEALGTAIGDANGQQKFIIDLCVSADEHTREEDDSVYAVTAGLIVTEDASGFSHKFTAITEN